MSFRLQPGGVTGNPDHPFTQGVICGKVRAYAERVHSPLRVLHPLRRVGAKGEGRFERISWEAAIAEIADRSSAAGSWPCRPCHPGEARPNWEVFGMLARALGVAEAHYAKSPEQLIRGFLAAGDETVRGITYERLRAERSVRVNLPRPYLPFADGAHAVGEGGVLLRGAGRARCIVPPNRFFLNSSFSQSQRLRSRQGTPTVLIAPDDAGRRGVRDGEGVRVFNDRGSVRLTARVTDATRPGVVVIEGIWWHRFHSGGQGVNVHQRSRDRYGQRPCFSLQPGRGRAHLTAGRIMRACPPALIRAGEAGAARPAP